MFDRRYYEKIEEKRGIELHHFDNSDSRRWSVDRKLQSRSYCRIRSCDDFLDIFNVNICLLWAHYVIDEVYFRHIYVNCLYCLVNSCNRVLFCKFWFLTNFWSFWIYHCWSWSCGKFTGMQSLFSAYIFIFILWIRRGGYLIVEDLSYFSRLEDRRNINLEVFHERQTC